MWALGLLLIAATVLETFGILSVSHGELHCWELGAVGPTAQTVLGVSAVVAAAALGGLVNRLGRSPARATDAAVVIVLVWVHALVALGSIFVGLLQVWVWLADDLGSTPSGVGDNSFLIGAVYVGRALIPPLIAIVILSLAAIHRQHDAGGRRLTALAFVLPVAMAAVIFGVGLVLGATRC